MFLSNVVGFLHECDKTKPSGSHIEIEMKLLLDNRIKKPSFIKFNKQDNPIDKIIEACKYGNPSISQTINFIRTKTESMFVKQLVYENGMQMTSLKNYYTKTPLFHPIYFSTENPDDISYKLCANIEKKETDDIGSFDIVRFRFRYSVNFTHEELKNWRLDVTIIKETNDNSINSLKAIRDRIFNSTINVGNFKEYDWSFADRIEVELEYIGDITNFDIISASKCIKLLFSSRIREIKTYIECISDIALILKPNLIDKFINGHYGLKQLGASPVELNKKVYYTDILPKISDFIITEKIDGVRSMIIIYPKRGECYIINNTTDKGMTYHKFSDEKTNPDLIGDVDRIILDSEYVKDADRDMYYVFDIIDYRVNGFSDIHTKPFDIRLELFKQIVDNNNFYLNGNKFLYNKHFMNIKSSQDIHDIKEFYNTMLLNEYKIDGLIFISKNSDYNAKWKPHMTIDFVAKTCPLNMLGIYPYEVKEGKTLYLLFCGIRSTEYRKHGVERLKCYDKIFNNVCVNKYGKTFDKYIPVQFSPSSEPYAYLFWSDNPGLNDKVLELSYDIKAKEWELFKIRDDRISDLKRKSYYGNYFKYAENIWMNYKNQLTLELLYKPENTSYFREASNSYTAVRKFNNYVKKQIIDLNSNHVDKNFIIDLASGQGQDLFKYIERGFKNILMVEKDIDALSEIINRKYLYINSNDPKLQNNSRIFIKQLDLTSDYKTNLGEMRESSQFIVCNFALHYIVNNKKNTQNFVNLLNKLLEPGGIFIFTAFDGLKIFKLLQEKSDENGEWNKYDENGALIYSIRKKYKTDMFTGSCQNIEVLLPFTGGKYYTEGLINIENLKQEMSKKKINLVAEDSFGIYLTKFDTDKPYFSKKLSELDKEYASLYNFYIFHKQNKLVNRNR